MVERLAKRETTAKKIEGGGNYFAAPKSKLDFIGSGCQTLDLSLGGGWAEDRIANIVGDKSSGKTLLCIEAAANFALQYPKKGLIKYREVEAAFDQDYAGALGMPLDRVDFGDTPLETVEDLFEELDKACAESQRERTLYICDSLDALSDRAELGRNMDDGTFGAEKAKKMSQMFRRLVGRMSRSHVTLIIVSQVRDKIGAYGPGRKTTRSGGRALDFYASQVIYLAQTGRIVQTISGVKRAVGVNVLAKVDKNKVSLPYREAAFSIRFGYGVDDITACLEWLKEAKSLNKVNVDPNKIKEYVNNLLRAPDEEYYAAVENIHSVVEDKWYAIERAFMPGRSKYARG